MSRSPLTQQPPDLPGNPRPQRISVLVPSYRRPHDLERCLLALSSQERQPEEILIVARSGDQDTVDVVKAWSNRIPLRIAFVSTPGQVSALNTGLESITGDIVAITDDDASPHPDWLAKIGAHFAVRSDLGGLGGRDWIKGGEREQEQRNVGRIQWFGRILGNHHLGTGQAREVDILKGANMSFRVSALDGIRFDHHLRGQGAQVHNDMAICLELKRSGWKIVYDPDTGVDHYVGIRHDLDQRAVFDPVAATNRGFNKHWALSRCMQSGIRRSLALFWEAAVGTRDEPGFLCFVRAAVKRDPCALAAWRCARDGRRQAAMEMQKPTCARKIERKTRLCV